MAFHTDLKAVKKYLKPIRIGQLEQETQETEGDDAVKRDFEELRQTAEKMVS